jgi:hypothetical protein
MNRKLSSEEISEKIKIHIRFLERSFEIFDQHIDQEDEAIRIAILIRALVYDTGNSTSALKLLDKKDITFYSYIHKFERPPLPAGEQYDQTQGFYTPLAHMVLGGNYRPGTYLSICDGGGDPDVVLAFQDWWNEIVLRLNGHVFTREQIIVKVANKMGAHISDKLPDDIYESLKRDALPMVVSVNGVEDYPLNNAIFPTIRSIGQELHFSIARGLSLKS